MNNDEREKLDTLRTAYLEAKYRYAVSLTDMRAARRAKEKAEEEFQRLESELWIRERTPK